MKQLKVNITKEVLHMTRYCRYYHIPREGDYFVNPNNHKLAIANCAITYALYDTFPDCCVGLGDIVPFNYSPLIRLRMIEIGMPSNVINFILEFDKATPEQRIEMKPFSFIIDIQKVVDNLGYKWVDKQVSKSKFVELVK